MSIGYDKPLYVLPFDHRASYIKGMFSLKAPLTPEQHARVVDSKRLIYEGFLVALKRGVSASAAGILVDEEFGADILADAGAKGYLTAVSTEASGSDEFQFEYGDEFAAHLDKVRPTFAKALVRYNPEGDAALNERQTARLRTLSEHCAARGLPFMFELLVPATDAQRRTLAEQETGAPADASTLNDKDVAAGVTAAYERDLRPKLMRAAIERLQNDGVEPAIWKIEGLDTPDDAKMIAASARRDGRDTVGCIVLGRGANAQKVVDWLRIAAAVPAFTGFAVGRTSFWDPVAAYVAGDLPREEAAERIGAQYRQWVDTFESARPH